MRLLKSMTGIFSSDVSCGDRVGSTSEDELDAPEGRLALSHMPRDRLQALKQSGVHHRDLRIIVAHTIYDTLYELRVYLGLTPTNNPLCV